MPKNIWKKLDDIFVQAYSLDLIDLKTIVNYYQALLKDAERQHIEVSDMRLIQEHHQNALDLITELPPILEENPVNQATFKLTDIIMKMESNLIKPQQVSWFKQILRFILGNQNFWQNADEKQYQKQMELLSQLVNYNKKLSTQQNPTQELAEESSGEIQNDQSIGETTFDNGASQDSYFFSLSKLSSTSVLPSETLLEQTSLTEPIAAEANKTITPTTSESLNQIIQTSINVCEKSIAVMIPPGQFGYGDMLFGLKLLSQLQKKCEDIFANRPPIYLIVGSKEKENVIRLKGDLEYG